MTCLGHLRPIAPTGMINRPYNNVPKCLQFNLGQLDTNYHFDAENHYLLHTFEAKNDGYFSFELRPPAGKGPGCFGATDIRFEVCKTKSTL